MPAETRWKRTLTIELNRRTITDIGAGMKREVWQQLRVERPLSSERYELIWEPECR